MLFGKDYRDQVAAEVGSAAPNVVSKALGEKWAQGGGASKKGGRVEQSIVRI